MLDAELDEALTLIEKCTTEQITAVLRRYKEKGRVKVTAPNKEELIKKNLREAVRSGEVSKEDIYDLIRENEENGNQHVWFFRPKRGLAPLFEYASVAERLFGPKWQENVAQYPSLYLKPNSFTISDFRSSARKPKDWYLKIYGHAIVQRATGGRDERDEGRFWLEYQHQPLRSVILIRWNSPDLLEIRVQRDDSRRRTLAWYEEAWAHLKPAFLREQFTPWALEPVLAKLVTEADKHRELYDFRDVKLLDKSERLQTTYEPIDDEASLFDHKDVLQELQKKVAAGGTLRDLAVTWLKGKTAFESNLRVLLVTRNSNETLVASHCSARDLDHATDQLRRFS